MTCRYVERCRLRTPYVSPTLGSKEGQILRLYDIVRLLVFEASQISLRRDLCTSCIFSGPFSVVKAIVQSISRWPTSSETLLSCHKRSKLSCISDLIVSSIGPTLIDTIVRMIVSINCFKSSHRGSEYNPYRVVYGSIFLFSRMPLNSAFKFYLECGCALRIAVPCAGSIATDGLRCAL